jgi:hypothetical protein
VSGSLPPRLAVLCPALFFCFYPTAPRLDDRPDERRRPERRPAGATGFGTFQVGAQVFELRRFLVDLPGGLELEAKPQLKTTPLREWQDLAERLGCALTKAKSGTRDTSGVPVRYLIRDEYGELLFHKSRAGHELASEPPAPPRGSPGQAGDADQ